MPVQKKLLLETLGRVGLDDEAELLLALGEMAGKWADFAQEIDGFGSVLELVQAIAAGTSDDKVAAAFATIGAEDVLATLKRSADRLASLLEELPHSLKKLLEPIGAYDEAQTQTRDSGVVRWPLLDKGIGAGGDAVADTATDRATYALSLDAKAALIFEAGDTWPYSDAVAGPLLRLRAEGGLTSKTSARLPYSLGAATASASGSATCALEYYFAPADPRTIYALALAQRVPRLVDPFDFDAVWNGFATSDLAGIHYGFEGGAKFDLAVSLADAGALGTALKAELAASVTIGVELTGKYFLTFRVAPAKPEANCGSLRRCRESAAAAAISGSSLVARSILAGWPRVCTASSLARSTNGTRCCAKSRPTWRPGLSCKARLRRCSTTRPGLSSRTRRCATRWSATCAGRSESASRTNRSCPPGWRDGFRVRSIPRKAGRKIAPRP